MNTRSPTPSLALLVSVMTLSHTVASFGNLSIPPLTPFLRDELQLTYAQVGMLTSFIYIGVVSASIPAGWATDFLGERWALICGLAIQGVFTLCFSLTHSFLLGGLFLLLSGIGYSGINPATTKGVMRWFPVQGRATAMGLKQTGIPLGGILAAFTLPGLSLAFGWRVSVMVVGCTSILCILAVRWGMPQSGETQNAPSALQWTRFREVLSNRSIIALSVMGIFVAGAQLSIVTHLVLFLKKEYLFSSVLAGLFLAASQAGGVAGRIGWGLMSDFLVGGKRKGILIIIGVIAILQLLFMSRMGPGISGGFLLFFIGFLGATTIGYHGVLYGLLGEMVQKEVVGLATGFILTITFIGVVVFPPLFGHLVDRLGSYTLAWDLLALSWVAALFILIFFVKEGESIRGGPEVRLDNTSSN